MKEINLNIVDRIANFIKPSWGTKRMAQRFAQQQAKSLMRRYEAAGTGRRTDNWKATGTSASTEIQAALFNLRNRSRDLARNNGYAKNAVKKVASNTVGYGILPNPKSSSKPQLKKLMELWKQWADKTFCDYDGHNNFYGIEKLVMRTVAESGECLVRKRIVADKSLPFPLQLQVLEPDFIDTTKYIQQTESGGFIFYGIEFSKAGKIIAFWLFDTHPGDTSVNFNLTSKRYPADEIIHVFEKERPGQFRGVPWLHAAMLRLKDLDEYEDAQLIRQKIAACFSVFVTDSAPAIGVQSTQTEDELLDKVEPGIIQTLKPGQSVTMASPPGAEGYGDYTKNVLRGIAAGVGMDYATLTGDLTQVNFSSGRMGWVEFHRNVTEWQFQMLIPMFCDKAFEWFLQIAAIYGYILPNTKITADWTPPRRDMIDPSKEVGAMIEGYQGGLFTWSDVQLELGYNPDDQIEKMKEDQKKFKEAGLPNYTDKNTAPKPTTPAPDPNNTDTNQ